MAALFLQYSDNNNAFGSTLFKDSLTVTPNCYIGFLQDIIGTSGFLVVSEVTVQHHDTIQYFLTFDDVINYFYFGKGLGAMSISGSVFANCQGNWPSINTLLNRIGKIRGTSQTVQFGGISFTCVLSAFSVKASADAMSTHCVDYTLQLDIIDNSLPPAVFPNPCP